ncbi:MAG: hypothetical protein AB4290_06640 [Spirulina sp.]
MSKHYCFTSVTRISDLQENSFHITTLPKAEWGTGDYVVGEITAPLTQTSILEDCHGRMVEVNAGTRAIGAFGSRRATLEIVGDWREIGADDRMEALTEGGLFGKATSVAVTCTNLPPLVYRGHVMREDHKVCMMDFVPHVRDRNYTCPTIMMLGTSMSSGKTTMSRLLIGLLKDLNLKVVGVKLAGAGQYHDILSMQDAGADAIFDFVNVGLPSTVCSPEDYQIAMSRVLSLVAGENPDVVVAEIGASPFEPYNGSLVLQAMEKQICLTVLCASDPYAILGATHDFHLAPDLISGIVTDTTAGVELVEKLTGLPAISPTDDRAVAKLMPILQEKLQLLPA